MELEGGRFFRGSTRSKGSSSTSDVDPREKVKDCCRKVISFMCTQVGVGGLVVGYTIVGAFAFRYIESQGVEEQTQYNESMKFQNQCLENMWDIAETMSTVSESLFQEKTDEYLKEYQSKLVYLYRHGYRKKELSVIKEIWSFPASLMFSLSIITMIGYGNMTPKTGWGKALTVMYAIFGIPLYILYFLNMGEVLAGCFRWVYTWLYECSTERRDENIAPRRVIVPSSACLWVIGGYVLTGAIMFAEWEEWNYLNSTYFCVTSLCKIGFGDYVPGANIFSDSKEGNQTKLVINFIYMLVGLGLVAMCYNLMREEIRAKLTELKEDINVKCWSMLGASTPACPLRLCGISGYDKRVNDVVYCPPTVPNEQYSTVVFFGGDVQDFPENMQSHRDNKNYIKWNLEDTARILHSHFPDCHIVVVRPARIEYKTFSCFENFVPGNNCGAPEHTPTHYALQHLEKLLQGVSEKLRSITETELAQTTSLPSSDCDEENTTETAVLPTKNSNDSLTSPSSPDGRLERRVSKCMMWWRENINLDKNDLILIGFSKGSVVLNQFLYEFHYLKTLTPDDNTMMQIVSRIKDMYWLDGGHSGGKNTWITSRSLLETLTRLGIKVHVHVTPYQINDDRRPWIRKEEKMFSDLLQRLGAPVNRVVHFENVFPNLLMHFDVLTAFRHPAGSPK